MADIVGRIIKPTAAFIEELARKLPEAFGKGHHRIGQSIHKAADEFDKAEDDLTAKAGRHAHNFGEGHHDPEDLAGAGTAAAAGAKGGERAAHNAAGDEDSPNDLRPGDPDRHSVEGANKVCKTDPVDVATGDVLMPATDVHLLAALPLVLRRTHISSYRHGIWFGPSWASTLDQRLQLDASGVVFAAADGMRLEYPPPRANTDVRPLRGPRLPLTWSGRPNDAMRVSDPRTGETLVFDHPRPAPGNPGAVTLRLTAIEDRNHRRIDITWSDDDTPVLITHHGGYRVAIDCHPELRRITAYRLLDSDGPGTETTLARYVYDEAGDLVEFYDSGEAPLRLSYDRQHRITGWTDRNACEYAYGYDDAGRVAATAGSNGCLSATFSYDESSRSTLFTNSLGHTTTFEHNEAYRLVRETDPLGSTTVQTWDSANRLITSVTDPLGRPTRYGYDEAENLVSITRPDGTLTTARYNEQCLPVEFTDPDGQVWRHEYDSRGNLLSTTDPNGATTRHTYDESGDLVATTDALGTTRRVSNNPAGLPLSLTNPQEAVTTADRDAFGRIVRLVDPLGRTSRFGWSVEGLPLWKELADGSRESWTYDGEGNLTSHSDALGHVTTHVPAPFDVPASTSTPAGGTYAFTYDTELNLVQVTGPRGLTWDYVYDPAGRLVSESDFNGRTLTYSYDATDQLLSRTNGAGEAVTFLRDPVGRVVERRSATGDSRYVYSPGGALLRSIADGCEVSRAYDAVGRLVEETVNGRRMTYGYDAIGRRTERRTPSGIVSTWTYDSSDRPETLTCAARTIEFAFDAADRETARRVGRHTVLTQGWDQIDRLLVQTVATDQGHQRLQHRKYRYRSDGAVTRIEELAGSTRDVEVDTVGRVTGVRGDGWTETYAYDVLGNLTRADTPLTGPDDTAREVSGTLLNRAGRSTHTYDGQGRLVRTDKRLLNGQRRTWTLTWNTDDQLTDVVTPEGRWTYLYDPQGRRTAKRRMTPDGGVAEEFTFSWDGTRLAEQADPAGRATTWEYAPESHRPLAQLDRAPRTPQKDARFHAVITDPVGTPTELVSEDGELDWRLRTTLWGIPLPASGSGGVTCPLRFAGQYADAETGWNYNYFRYYDPWSGRYLSPDPLGLEPAPNHHTYVDNPYAWTDPLGLTPCQDAAKNAAARNQTVLGPHVPTRGPASVGRAAHHKYKKTFFGAHPSLKGQVVVHHAIEQQILRRYPGLFSADEIHSLENLRGIPKGAINNTVHLSQIRREWNGFYASHPSPTRQQVLDFATSVDDKLGSWFSPRIR